MSETLLQLTAIDKTFGDVVALREARLYVRAGEVLGLAGASGAGKSTLINIATGLFPADSGVLLLEGKTVTFANCREAVERGIVPVRQEAVHFAQLSIAENMLLGRGLVRGGGFINWGKTFREAQDLLGAFGEPVDVRQEARFLSAADRTRAELAVALAAAPKVLFLDGPTASLAPREVEELFARIERLKATGSGIVLVSHCPEELLDHCDRVAIMRDGAMIESRPTAGLSVSALVSLVEGTKTGAARATMERAAGVARAGDPVRPAGTAPDPTEKRRGQGRHRPSAPGLGPGLRALAILAAIGMLGISMGLLAPDAFANTRNALDILWRASTLALLAHGAVLLLCAGGIDLSAGAMLGLLVSLATLAEQAGFPAPLRLVAVLAMGLTFSLAQGGLALATRIHPVFVTLVGLGICWGATRALPGGGEGSFPLGSQSAVAGGRWLGVPIACYCAAAATLFSHVLLRNTLLGRQLLAVGNSPRAARLIGLSKVKLTLFAFGCSGLLVGLCAVLTGSGGSPVQTGAGAGLAVQAIAAAVIGGANLLGGRGSALGAFLGAVLVALLSNSLTVLGADPVFQPVAACGLILVALAADALAGRLRRYT